MRFRFIYTGIRVRSMDESIRFYTEVLGMQVFEARQSTVPTKGEVVTLRSTGANQLLELNFYEENSPFYSAYANGEELDHLAFDVENLQEAIDQLKAKGVEVIVEPYVIGGWKEAFVRDPNGIWIELLERKDEGRQGVKAVMPEADSSWD